jgi:alpha-glucosidase
VILLAQRGTPFLYAGEELGLEDAVVGPDQVVDPGGRDGCRAPIPWTLAAPHGWGPTPWLPFPPEPDRRSAEAQRADPASILHLYRRLLQARRASAALRDGDQEVLEAAPAVLAWRRTAPDGDVRTVLVNMGADDVDVDVTGSVEVASDGIGEGDAFTGPLRADTAVILR